MKAISINCDKMDWVELILRKHNPKTVETRNQRTLDPIAGEEVALIRRQGNDRKVVALVVFEPYKYVWDNEKDFDRDFHLHKVCHDCPYHWDGGKRKYGYPIRITHRLRRPVALGPMKRGNGGWTVRRLTPEEEKAIRAEIR